MATIINNPQPVEQTNRGSGFLIGIILLIAIVILFLFYGLPSFRGMGGGAQVAVPGSVNVHTK